MKSKSLVGPLLLVGGGTATALGAWWASRRSASVADKTREAVATGGTFQVRATGYWPFSARPDERKMEGGVFDRKMPVQYKNQPESQQYKDHLLHTLEDFQAGKAPFVSVAGDYEIFPYGQRLSIDAWPNVIFRVVDTGGHFHGTGKLYRVMGYEPLDICVDSSETKVPKLVTAKIFPGDNFEGGARVATGKMKGQTVAGILDEAEADCNALARAVESNFGGRSREEAFAGAWVVRNRAEEAGVTVTDLLAPDGVFGAPHVSRGYVSTRKAPTTWSRDVAEHVLGASAESDPTNGAIDYWMPIVQSELHRLGDVYRAAVNSSDEERTDRYERYSDYGTEGEVRVQFAREGLKPISVIGSIELLGRSV